MQKRKRFFWFYKEIPFSYCLLNRIIIKTRLMFKNIFGRKFDRHSRYQKGEVKLGQIQSAGIFKKKIVANFFFAPFVHPTGLEPVT